MIANVPFFPLIVGAVLAVWLVLAVWALFTGLSMRRKAALARTHAAQLVDLLNSAPAVPLLIRPDGKLDAPDRLAAWLGRETAPTDLDALLDADGGLEPDHARALAAEIAAAQQGGRPFTLPVRVNGSDRMLLVRGGPVGTRLGKAGTVVLWVFDTTDSFAQIQELRGQVGQYRQALDALSGVIEAAPMPVWHRGADHQISLVNSAYVKAVDGKSAQDVIEQGIELVEAVDGISPRASAANAAARKAPTARMLPVTIDGKRRLMKVVDVPLGPSGVAGYAIDMQELEEVRAELRHLSQANRDMLDRLSAGVVQFGANQLLQFCNQPFLSLFGLTPETAAFDTHFDRVLDAMRDSGQVPDTPDFRAWRQERRNWFLSPSAHEEQWRLRDGVHLRVYAQPLPDGGLLVIFEDRTEHVQLASARDTLLRVRTATLDNLFEAIAVFASDGRLHLWNSRFTKIWSVPDTTMAAHPRVDELMSALADRLARPEQAGLVHQLIRAATMERRQRGGRIAFADGRFFEFAAIPLPDGNALFTMLDTTDSRHIEQALRDRNEALEDADRVKTAFVSNMSYELRTPLTSIVGFAEMMEAGYAGELSAQSRDYVNAIMTATTRLTRLIDNVLDLTQGAAGGLPIERRDIDVAAMVRQVVEGLSDKADSRDVTVDMSFEQEPGTVSGDERRLRQALAHVVDNGVSFVSRGGRVLVHVQPAPDVVRIIVSDDGPGIDAKTQAHLFDVFVRFGRHGDGANQGLGLPLVRQFVEAHGGSVDLVSEPGQGTSVTLTLPRGE
ncbi:signal transduction histidine kinase [Sphingobium sp. B2D3A]|nr:MULTISPECIES: PAS domain-containing sensor histidine kinase [unclassified Sphingobium]MCW2337822.1 signal transduction histidine kinase [Sphingobium sp. B2D3A]MCW2350548.1 signal transduction histidine kinase [Sphingobium sp. B12D2B]MCW2369650.1 signal transduction histidine kinase [Sphingobium sp. B11D3D]MCW2384280.1 signal transduction histidine kinase [Sphingobium sp. B2D3D]